MRRRLALHPGDALDEAVGAVDATADGRWRNAFFPRATKNASSLAPAYELESAAAPSTGRT